MPKILDIWLAKFTFLEMGLKFVLAKLIKDLSQMSLVLLSSYPYKEEYCQGRLNKVINVTRHHRIHQTLESRQCITQSKWKYSVFKQPIPAYKSCLFTGIVC